MSEVVTRKPLDELTFDDSFVRALPADPSVVTRPRQVHAACYSFTQPTPVAAPKLLAWSDQAAALLGVQRPPTESGPLVDVLAGNRIVGGMRPFAACYGGHQFGHWAGQLGDGRAISLAEVIGPSGQRWEMQLKGAGLTPYSRTADGRAVLRSSIREFLCSEAMHHLGVPTTRALCLVGTGEPVVRDMFYDGNARPEPGAIVTRLSPSFVRFGNFEILASRKDEALLAQLAAYVLQHHYPELGAPSPETYARWFAEICRRTAVMVAHWLRVGFIHGVMNTDNMSILGLTIDYGPYGWLDSYDPGFTPNTTDAQGRRYCFARQPSIAQWNLAQLAQALLPLIKETAPLEAGLELFANTFNDTYREMMLGKLGLTAAGPHADADEDDFLIHELLACFGQIETDMTLFYRKLAELPLDAAAQADVAANFARLRDTFYTPDEITEEQRMRFSTWLRRYMARAAHEPSDSSSRRASMNRFNPYIIPRNYLVQAAIDEAEQGDASRVTSLLEAFEHPYEERAEHEPLTHKRPDWARAAPGCSALSCSS